MNKEKLLDIYLGIYSILCFFSANIILVKILDHFNLYNNLTGFIVLLITIFSQVALEHRDSLFLNKKGK